MKKKILSLGFFLLAGAMLNTSLEAAKMKIGMTVDDLR